MAFEVSVGAEAACTIGTFVKTIRDFFGAGFFFHVDGTYVWSIEQIRRGLLIISLHKKPPTNIMG